MPELLERRFYKRTEQGDEIVDLLQDADYMIIKELMTKEEVTKIYPLHKF